ncbi:histone deacetylase family protein [uncultured Chloroflexus sp.]|uniref:histone deacetylase family protein n=1 Tax=uncultured Chloroflexus sp. TaxID=214040 RepID=UPI002622BD0D|nr:histone deacetylase family protein [uncultured Chloroflexus sp.]
MNIFLSADHHRHDPPFEILDGKTVPYFETPQRVTIILAALQAAGFAPPVTAPPATIAELATVHTPDYLDYLAHAYERWQAAGLRGPVMPSAWPLPGLRVRSDCPQAAAGRYTFDLSAPITAGTFAAARASAGAALAGAAALLQGERFAYALCRPPGHHAAANLAGGYCYLNNAALAADRLARATATADTTWTLRAPAVAVLDIDYHHGNGTQSIFYERNDVLTVSLHADPAREYPYFLGYADERGAGAGEGYNLNIPLPAGTGDSEYLAALAQALQAIADYGPRYLVVSAGFDTFHADPLGDFELTTAAYRAIGAAIGQLGLPTLIVQEGGYAIEALGTNVATLLDGVISHADE